MAKIAFLGLGNMGLPMAANLAKAGHAVTGFDLVEAAKEAASASGVAITGNAREAVAGADTVVTMLPAGRHVLAAWADFLPAAPEGALVIDSSTIDVDSAKRAHEMGAAAGAAAFLTTSLISGDGVTIPLSVWKATRNRRRSTARGSPSDMGTMAVSCPSTPEITGSTSIRSSTNLASGPICQIASSNPPGPGKCPVRGTRPEVGLMLAIPVQWAGKRTLPPASLPNPRGEPPAAIMADSPPLLPPGDRFRS